MTTKAELIALMRKLHRALVLTKIDAELHGVSYGLQSVCVKAIKAFEKWDKSNENRN